MTKYVLSVDAELDLDQIWEYIAEDNIDAADRWIAKLFDAFESLTQTPGIGHKREDLTSFPILFWPVGAYLILYRVQAEWVEIVAVSQGGRDIPTFTHSTRAIETAVQVRSSLRRQLNPHRLHNRQHRVAVTS